MPAMSDYEDWCGGNRLWLNFNTEIDIPQEGHFRDEVEFKLDEKHSIIWEDVVASFDHCRRILFNFFLNTNNGAIDNGRDENSESLIDCFIRLYSVLDK